MLTATATVGQARQAELLLGGALVERQTRTRRVGTLIGTAHTCQHGLHESVFARSAVQVDEGEIMLQGFIQQVVEVGKKVKIGDLMTARFQGRNHGPSAAQ